MLPVRCDPFLWAHLPGGEWRSYWRSCTVSKCQACGKPSRPGPDREKLLEEEQKQLEQRQQHEAQIQRSKHLDPAGRFPRKVPVQAPPGTFPEGHDPQEVVNVVRIVCGQKGCVSVDTLLYKGVEYPNLYSREVSELVREGTTEDIAWASTATRAPTGLAFKRRQRRDEATKCPFCCLGFPDGCTEPIWLPC
jgi:hypothetical protein